MGDETSSYGRIFGQEKNLATSAIARMNLFLHGAQDFKLSQGDTLRSPNFVEHNQLKTFDCVIANPPFSLKSGVQSSLHLIFMVVICGDVLLTLVQILLGYSTWSSP